MKRNYSYTSLNRSTQSVLCSGLWPPGKFSDVQLLEASQTVIVPTNEY